MSARGVAGAVGWGLVGLVYVVGVYVAQGVCKALGIKVWR